jgi:hypothetical protein
VQLRAEPSASWRKGHQCLAPSSAQTHRRLVLQPRHRPWEFNAALCLVTPVAPSWVSLCGPGVGRADPFRWPTSCTAGGQGRASRTSPGPFGRGKRKADTACDPQPRTYFESRDR